jgi:hypothetical protein
MKNKSANIKVCSLLKRIPHNSMRDVILFTTLILTISGRMTTPVVWPTPLRRSLAHMRQSCRRSAYANVPVRSRQDSNNDSMSALLQAGIAHRQDYQFTIAVIELQHADVACKAALF